MLIENIYLTNAVIYFYMFSIFYFLQTSLFTLPMKSKCLSTYSWVVSFGYFKSRVSFRAIRLCLTVSFKWAGEENHRLITCRHNIGKRLHMWPSSCPKWWVGYTHKNFHLNLNFRIWLWLFFFFFIPLPSSTIFKGISWTTTKKCTSHYNEANCGKLGSFVDKLYLWK